MSDILVRLVVSADGVTRVLERVRDDVADTKKKIEDPSDLYVLTTNAKGKLELVEKAVYDAKHKIEEPKTFTVDTSGAQSAIEKLRDSVAMWGLAIQGAVGMFNKITGAFQKFIGPAQEMQKYQNELAASLHATGIHSDALVKKLQDQASEIQSLTIYEDDLIASGTALMQNIGQMSADQLPKAQKAAIGLAAAYRIDLTTAFQLVGKAAAGNTGLLGRYGIVLKSTGGHQEKLNELLEIGASKFELAEAEAQTALGAIEQFKNIAGDFMEVLGEGLLPLIAGILKPLQKILEWFMSLNGVARTTLILTPLLTAAWYAYTTSAVAATVASGGLTAGLAAVTTALKTFWTNLGPVGWAILGIGAAITALSVALGKSKEEIEETTDSLLEMRNAMDGVQESAQAEVEEFDALMGSLLDLKRKSQDTTVHKREMKVLIEQINDKYGDYLGNLDLERASYDQVAQAANKAASAIMSKKLAEGFSQMASEQAKAVAELTFKYEQVHQAWLKASTQKVDMTKVTGDFGDSAWDKQNERIKQLKAQKDEIGRDLKTAKIMLKNMIDSYRGAASDYDEIMGEIGSTPSALAGGGAMKSAAKELVKGTAEYYDAVKFMDAEYYEWKKAQIREEVEAYQISADEKALLLEKMYADLDDDKANWEESLRQQAEMEARLREEAEARLGAQTAAYYNEMKFLDAGYYEWKKAQIEADVAAMEIGADKQETLLQERMKALDAEKKAFDDEPYLERQKRLDDILQQQISAIREYFGEVKFLDDNYYEWKKARIGLETAQLKLSDDRYQVLLAQRLAALEEEKAAFERLPVEAVMARYNEWKRGVADSSEIGITAWSQVIEGLETFLEELHEFEHLDGVTAIIAGIEKELDEARSRADNKGNWFWHGLLGFDPDRASDQKKIQDIKQVFSDLQGRISEIMNQAVVVNQQRWDAEIDALEEKAEREVWTEEMVQAEREKINARYLEEERKLKNLQKAMAVAQAIINTAEGVTKALTLGPVLGPAMALAMGALGAYQVKLIQAQKFAAGGLFKGIGGPREDANIIAVSDGEYIVNADSTKRYKPVLDAINFGVARAAAAPQLAFAGGGAVTGGVRLDAIEKKLDVINMNLVKKELCVTVENTGEIESTIRKGDKVRKGMERRGYRSDLQR